MTPHPELPPFNPGSCPSCPVGVPVGRQCGVRQVRPTGLSEQIRLRPGKSKGRGAYSQHHAGPAVEGSSALGTAAASLRLPAPADPCLAFPRAKGL